MPLPTFIVIGAMKSATTSLWAYLAQHPEVFLPAEKEPSFFVEALGWTRGRAWYESLFEGAEGHAAAGEASTNYTKAHRFKGVPERIAAMLPDVRLVYLMRDPVERMISHYLHNRATSQEDLPIERAFVEHPTYLNTSRYAFQLDGYLERFPRDQLLLLTSESLRDRREETLERLFAFIGVNPARARATTERVEHASAEKPIRALTAAKAERSTAYRVLRRLVPLPAKRLYNRLSTTSMSVSDVRLSDGTRERLLETLRPEVAALRPLMPSDFDGWGIA